MKANILLWRVRRTSGSIQMAIGLHSVENNSYMYTVPQGWHVVHNSWSKFGSDGVNFTKAGHHQWDWSRAALCHHCLKLVQSLLDFCMDTKQGEQQDVRYVKHGEIRARPKLTMIDWNCTRFWQIAAPWSQGKLWFFNFPVSFMTLTNILQYTRSKVWKKHH